MEHSSEVRIEVGQRWRSRNSGLIYEIMGVGIHNKGMYLKEQLETTYSDMAIRSNFILDEEYIVSRILTKYANEL